MAIKIIEIPNKSTTIPLRIAKGHFATSHSHINYYVDLTGTKYRLNEAREAAKVLARKYKTDTIGDTILCLDGTEVVGACMARELTEGGLRSINRLQSINVVTPEHTTGSQLLFRENIAPMIQGKHVMILAASISTGFTVQGGIEAVRYYGGMTVGVCSLFASVKECCGFPVTTVFDAGLLLKDYSSTPYHECPLCKAGEKVDAIVNTYGISSF